MRNCPDLGELLCLLDEWGTTTEARWFADHLVVCARCRAEVREHQGLMRAAQIHQAGAEFVARGEARLRRSMWQIDREAAVARRRVYRGWVFASVAAVVALVLGSYVSWSFVSRDPNDVLNEAVRRDGSGAEWRFVRVELSRVPVEGRSESSATYEIPASAWETSENAPKVVVQGLRAAGIDVVRPLSAAAFGAWRRSHPRRRDTVWSTHDLLVLQSTASERVAVPYAELRLERTSYRVVGQAWVVAGLGRVDIRGIVEPTGLVAAVRGESTAATEATTEELERLELSVRSATHDLQVDDAVNVAVVGGRIRASGTASAKQQVELTRRLAILSPLIDTTILKRDEGTLRVVSNPFAVALNLNDEQRSVVANDVGRYARSLARRHLAMEGLAKRYPQASVARLSRARREELVKLVGEHVRRWRADMLALDARLMLLAGSVDRCALPGATPADWRQRVRDSGASTADVVRDVSDVLESQGETTTVQREHLARRFGDLWSQWCASVPSRGSRQ